MSKYFTVVALLVISFLSPAALYAEEPAEIIKKSQGAFFYPGKDMQARVKMALIAKTGQERLRELTMLRINGSGGDQKYFMYFHNPGDVRGMSFMVYKYPNKDDDRWLFIPSINLVNRIAARDSRSCFFGSDFNSEEVAGRAVKDDTQRT